MDDTPNINQKLMDDIPKFEGFQKIPRLTRGCVVTEKIDGTNGNILVLEDGRVVAGSRTRWITPEQDNHGFALWVQQNTEALQGLGVGVHRGEWWGQGIQRKYGQDRKRFSLFNTSKWLPQALRPACCECVPILYEGVFDTQVIEEILRGLAQTGSIAAPGFMKPEGIVIFHVASKMLFKKTIENDEVPKGKEER